MKLYAVSGNAGWFVKPLNQDHIGWIDADFIFAVAENGTVKMAKNRKSGEDVEFLNVEAVINYMQEYYNFSSSGVELHKLYFVNISDSRAELRERSRKIREYRIKMNRHVEYFELEDLSL